MRSNIFLQTSSSLSIGYCNRAIFCFYLISSSSTVEIWNLLPQSTILQV